MIEKGIETFYRKAYKDKVTIVSRILRGDRESAEDIVQEAFYRALKFKLSYDPEMGSLDKWFNSIMFNYLREHQKSQKNSPESGATCISAENILNELGIEKKRENQEQIDLAINSVKNLTHRRVLRLFFVLGYTSTEISQIELDISQTNVTTIVNRFKEGL
jgi:RNA polymerase sigma factor (sigma-70 family)